MVGTSKGNRVIEPWDGVANDIGGPSKSLLLGIADIEDVDLRCLSVVSKRVSTRCRDDTCRSMGGVVVRETMSGVGDSVIVRLRLGVDTPEGVAAGSPAAERRSRDSWA
jgi:hypothetical protein